MADIVRERSVLLSRELSHFMLNVWYLEDHPELDRRKHIYFGVPCVEAFLLNDRLYYDPSVGIYQTHLKSSLLKDNPLFKELTAEGVLQQLPVDNGEYENAFSRALSSTVEFAQLLLQRRRKRCFYNYFHLLESPLSLFVRESDRILQTAWNASERLRHARNYLRGLLPFVFSSFLCVELQKISGVPFLCSPLAEPFLNEIAEAYVLRETVAAREDALKALHALVEEQNMRFVSEKRIRVPDLADFCGKGAVSNRQLLRNALDLRNAPHCTDFRGVLWDIVAAYREDPTCTPAEALVKEYRVARDRLIANQPKTLSARLGESFISVLLTAPLSVVLGPLSSCLAALGISGIKDVVESSTFRKDYGWFYFVYENLEFPKENVG